MNVRQENKLQNELNSSASKDVSTSVRSLAARYKRFGGGQTLDEKQKQYKEVACCRVTSHLMCGKLFAR